MLEIFILSIIQGITEFLPISSSSHLIIASKFLEFKNHGLNIDVSLHIGSFVAVITYFYKDIINFYENKKIFYKILLSSLPIMIIGFILIKSNLIEEIRSVKIIAWSTILFGILLYISDRCSLENDVKKDLNFKSAIFIGLLQIFSLVPGVSRSGIAITASRFLKFKREEAAKISFLLSIPILGSVSIYGLGKILISNDSIFSQLNIVSILLSFIFSFLTIKYFLNYIKKSTLDIFVYYRILLGFILLAITYL